jgi:16S rRNA U516 pseudouridylate synthase RsuA-like enzyme
MRVEEAYKKKCAVLCELNSVFGTLAKRKTVNIIVTRASAVGKEKSTRLDKNTSGLKKFVIVNNIELQQEVAQLRREVTTTYVELDSQVNEFANLVARNISRLQ